MSDTTPHPSGPGADATDGPISVRVQARVHLAELAVSRRRGSRVQRARLSQGSAGGSPEQQREARALRRVFLDLGDLYRDYRRRTGAAVSPEVRDAAYRFQRELSLASLVSVAASVDRLEALSW
jgi:hypothetical protein